MVRRTRSSSDPLLPRRFQPHVSREGRGRRQRPRSVVRVPLTSSVVRLLVGHRLRPLALGVIGPLVGRRLRPLAFGVVRLSSSGIGSVRSPSAKSPFAGRFSLGISASFGINFACRAIAGRTTSSPHRARCPWEANLGTATRPLRAAPLQARTSMSLDAERPPRCIADRDLGELHRATGQLGVRSGPARPAALRTIGRNVDAGPSRTVSQLDRVAGRAPRRVDGERDHFSQISRRPCPSLR